MVWEQWDVTGHTVCPQSHAIGMVLTILPYPFILQAWCPLLPPPSHHWLLQEHPLVLHQSLCCLLLQQTSSYSLQSCLHTELLHGSPPPHFLPLCTACRLCYCTDDTLSDLWTLQVLANSWMKISTTNCSSENLLAFLWERSRLFGCGCKLTTYIHVVGDEGNINSDVPNIIILMTEGTHINSITHSFLHRGLSNMIAIALNEVDSWPMFIRKIFEYMQSATVIVPVLALLL